MNEIAELHRKRDEQEGYRRGAEREPLIHNYGALNSSAPTNYTEAYTADDRRAVERIYLWLADGQQHVPGHPQQRTRAKLARAASLNVKTVSLILLGRYPSPPGKQLQQMLAVIDRENRRRRTVIEIPWVDTTVSRSVFAVCHRAHLYRDLGLIAARPGTGKTVALKRYAEEVDSAILIEASYNMSVGLLLDELIDRTNAEVRTARNGSRGTQAQRRIAVIETLKGSDTLILVDEADTLTSSALEELRRISDLANVGVVLAGEPRLHGMMRSPDGRFGRIHSRIRFWGPVIQSITEDDCMALVTAGHETDQVELTAEIHDAYWQTCEGSARSLSKLLPNVRDFGMAQGHALSAKLIFSVAQQTMGIQTRGVRA